MEGVGAALAPLPLPLVVPLVLAGLPLVQLLPREVIAVLLALAPPTKALVLAAPESDSDSESEGLEIGS